MAAFDEQPDATVEEQCRHSFEQGKIEGQRESADKIKKLEADVLSWQDELRLWKSSWLRNLGGSLIHKSHEIDAYAGTTAQMRQELASVKDALAAIEKLAARTLVRQP